MQVTVHGNARGPVRNDFTNTQANSPEVQLLRARARVAELEHKHAEAQSTFKTAVEDEDTNRDLQALKINVHRLARELEDASEEVRVRENLAMQRELDCLPGLIEELRAKRAKFIDLYRATCAALGDYCAGVGEATRLANTQMRLHENALNYSSHRNALLELAKRPQPLKGFSYSPVMDFGYDWALTIVPVHTSVQEKTGSE